MKIIETKVEDCGTSIRFVIGSFFPGGSSRSVKPAIRHLWMAPWPKTVMLLRLVLLAVLVSCAEAGRAANSLPVESTEPAAKLQQPAPPGGGKIVSGSIPAVVKEEATNSVRPAPSSAQAAGPARPAAGLPPADFLNLGLIFGLIVMGIMLLRKILPVVMDYLAPQLQVLGFARTALPEAWPKSLAEDEDISKFVPGFRTDPKSVPITTTEPVNPISSLTPEEPDGKRKRRNRLRSRSFLAGCPDR